MNTATFASAVLVQTAKSCGAFVVFGAGQLAGSVSGNTLVGVSGIEGFANKTLGTEVAGSAGLGATSVALRTVTNTASASFVVAAGLAQFGRGLGQVGLASSVVAQFSRTAILGVGASHIRTGCGLRRTHCCGLERSCQRVAEHALGAAAVFGASLEAAEAIVKAVADAASAVVVVFARFAVVAFCGEGLGLTNKLGAARVASTTFRVRFAGFWAVTVLLKERAEEIVVGVGSCGDCSAITEGLTAAGARCLVSNGGYAHDSDLSIHEVQRRTTGVAVTGALSLVFGGLVVEVNERAGADLEQGDVGCVFLIGRAVRRLGLNQPVAHYLDVGANPLGVHGRLVGRNGSYILDFLLQDHHSDVVARARILCVLRVLGHLQQLVVLASELAVGVGKVGAEGYVAEAVAADRIDTVCGCHHHLLGDQGTCAKG